MTKTTSRFDHWFFEFWIYLWFVFWDLWFQCHVQMTKNTSCWPSWNSAILILTIRPDHCKNEVSQPVPRGSLPDHHPQVDLLAIRRMEMEDIDTWRAILTTHDLCPRYGNSCSGSPTGDILHDPGPWSLKRRRKDQLKTTIGWIRANDYLLQGSIRILNRCIHYQ